LTGVALISVGVMIKEVFTDYEKLLDERFFSAPSLLITAGTIIFFIAFFGCCGAVKENHCMVFTVGV
jgi:CD63 antigen